MKTAEYELRCDERTRFEQDLFTPLIAILCTAVIVLYTVSSSVPGQFAGRNFHIPFWGAIAALVVLLIMWCMRLQRPRRYVIAEEGIEIVQPVVTHVIPFDQIVEVVSVADRRAQPLLRAATAGSCERAARGIASLAKRLVGGRGTIQLVPGDHNFTTSDTGGARIVCKNGGEALVSPMELSAFLRHIEAECSARGLNVPVVRETPVHITPSS